MPGGKSYTIHFCMQSEDFETPHRHVTVKQAYGTNIVYVMEGGVLPSAAKRKKYEPGGEQTERGSDTKPCRCGMQQGEH